MFISPVNSDIVVKGKLQDYRREAEEYRLAKELQGQGSGPSTGVKVGLALIGIISLLAAAGQFAIA